MAEHVFKSVATRIVQGTVTDDGGGKRQLSFDVVVVPGMGSNLFCYYGNAEGEVYDIYP